MTTEEKLAAIVAQAKEHDRIANSGEAECAECEWREAYCLMEIAWRAHLWLDQAQEYMCCAWDDVDKPGPCDCETCVENRKLVAKAEKVMEGIVP